MNDAWLLGGHVPLGYLHLREMHGACLQCLLFPHRPHPSCAPQAIQPRDEIPILETPLCCLDIRNRIVSVLGAKLPASDLQVSYSQGQN